MQGIKLTPVAQENLKKIVNHEFPLIRYANREERSWARFPKLFGGKIQPSAAKKWVDAPVQCLRPVSVEALSQHYFGGIEWDELEEWLNVEHSDIVAAISRLRGIAARRKEMKAELNQSPSLDLSTISTRALIKELTHRLEQLEERENNIYFDLSLDKPQPISLVSAWSEQNLRILMSISPVEKELLRELLANLDPAINVFEAVAVTTGSSALAQKIEESIFEGIDHAFSRGELDAFARCIPKIERYQGSVREFGTSHYDNWSNLLHDLRMWFCHGKPSRQVEGIA